MSTQTLLNEIKNISLTDFQKENVKNHFQRIRHFLENLGYSNIQKQGSFGRGTVIRGQENDGFDLDIAIVVLTPDSLKAKQVNLHLLKELKSLYHDSGQEIKLGKKAIQINVKSNFSIDITQIYKNLTTGEELVYNHYLQKFEPSYALEFRDLFKNKSQKSNDALRNLARIYKHLRDAIDQVKLKSIALEILLFQALNQKETSEQTMFSTLQNVEVLLRRMLDSNNFIKIKNPACPSDLIPTGMTCDEDVFQAIALNNLVTKAVEGAIVKNRPFHDLKRRFYTITQIEQERYFNSSVIPQGDTAISGGVYGGDVLDKNLWK